MSKIGFQDVRKSYGQLEVLHGINTEIETGEFIVIVGPSGCGKSTLLRMVAGLETITSGKVFINDRCVNELEPRERDIAMVFQNYALYPHMTVYQNMSYGLKNRKFPKKEIDARVNKAAEVLQLTEYLSRKPRQLSGGQRQRVAMGRAIVREPSVFLFDEPLSNLDAKLRNQMRVEIKKLQRMLGITSIYVTHDQVEAMTLADRLVVMNQGNADQIGTPMEVYSKPQTKFVAGFIGSPAMNFLPCQLSHGTKINLLNDRTYTLPNSLMTDSENITLGIRPEHICLKQQSGQDLPLMMQVELVEKLGADTIVYGKLPSFTDHFVIRLDPTVDVETGKSIKFYVSPESLHFFDDETEQRIEYRTSLEMAA